MKKSAKVFFTVILMISLFSCMGNKDVIMKNGLTVYLLKGSPADRNASLTLMTPDLMKGITAGKTPFEFRVENFKLGVQTEDASKKGIANSKDGQHIHFILNDEPYMAEYKNKFEVDMTYGHYVLLAFLSRSYHESVKSKSAYVLTQFDVGESMMKDVEEESMMENELDLKKPILFYSRPKGTYKGEEAKKLLLDFYLVNTDLSPSKNKVRAMINGTEFLLTKWTPYIIEGLPYGDIKIKLELIGPDGRLIEGPYNSVERMVTLVK